jgi:putative transposase
VFVPKRRQKAIFGQTRRQLGPDFPWVGAGQKECQILEGHLMPDHVHMGIASVIGFLKGKSAIAIARLCIKERDFTGEQPLGPPITRYRPSGSELEQVRQYIREQAVLNRAMRRATRDA